MARRAHKHDAILTAARRAFLERGFHGVGIEQIARAAKVSKVTIYAHFGDKESLLLGVLSREAANIEQQVRALSDEGTGLSERLVLIGVQLVFFLIQPDIIALERLIASLAPRFPELAHHFYAVGPRAGINLVAEVLRAADIENPTQAATDLFALWRGGMYFEATLGLRDPPSPEELEQHVVHGVSRLLSALG